MKLVLGEKLKPVPKRLSGLLIILAVVYNHGNYEIVGTLTDLGRHLTCCG